MISLSNIHTYIASYIVSGILFLVLTCGLGLSAFAQGGGDAAGNCLPGIPCSVNLTSNDLNNDSDGPNISGRPNAPKTDSQTCDADFMNQVYARAFLEASRETMLNQTVIRKPDSVLQYTCFDQRVKDTGNIAGPIFTESNRWQGVSVRLSSRKTVTLNVSMGTNKLDQSLNDLVTTSLNAYLQSNFSQGFLGGTASGISASGSSCGIMDSVFEVAKCNDFELDDQFQTFEELVGTDLRNVNGGSSCTSPITEDMLRVANNKDFAHVNFDKVDPFNTLMLSDSRTECAPPIKTGVKFRQDEFQYDSAGNITPVRSREVDDSICANPGCYYDVDSNTCKKQ